MNTYKGSTAFHAQRCRKRGNTRAPLRAAVRLQNASTLQTVHSTATGHESPRGLQYQLTYAPVWKSQYGDALRLESRLQTSREERDGVRENDISLANGRRWGGEGRGRA